jgi:hypothetical protein
MSDIQASILDSKSVAISYKCWLLMDPLMYFQ